MESKPDLTAHERRALALAALVSDRTAERFLAGLPVRAPLRARLELALDALGLARTDTDAGGAR